METRDTHYTDFHEKNHEKMLRVASKYKGMGHDIALNGGSRKELGKGHSVLCTNSSQGFSIRILIDPSAYFV